MKRWNWLFFLLAFLALMFMAVAVTPTSWAKEIHFGGKTIYAAQVTEPATSSGRAVKGAAVFYSIIVTTDGTNDVTINIRNGTSGGAAVVLPVSVPGDSQTWGIAPPYPIYCDKGIYVSASSTGDFSFVVQFDN